MAAHGPLDPRPAARLLFAAGILDLMLVYALVVMGYPSIRPLLHGLLPDALDDFALPVFFVLLLPVYWFVTDVVAGGYSPGRIALGLGMTDPAGRPLSLPRRFARFLGKLLCFGLTGLNLGRLSMYDSKTVWRCPMAAAARGDHYLFFLSGKQQGRGGRIGTLPGFDAAKPVRLGRDPSWSMVPIDDPGVSGKHCEIHFRDGVPMIRDLGSTRGTYVNGKRIPPNSLVPLAGAGKFSLAGQQMQLRA